MIAKNKNLIKSIKNALTPYLFPITAFWVIIKGLSTWYDNQKRESYTTEQRSWI